MDRVDTHSNSRTYDEDGNLSTFSDRKEQETAYEYDALDRLTRVTFDDASTIDYTYDAGDRGSTLIVRGGRVATGRCGTRLSCSRDCATSRLIECGESPASVS